MSEVSYGYPVASLRPHERAEAHFGGLTYGLLYLPVALAWGTAATPTLSYAVAWAGSWWILWASMTGRVKALPGGGRIRAQLMRPLGFTQSVFAGYLALTSVFYALDQLGVRPSFVAPTVPVPFAVVAEAQRYYLLAHAGVTTGILVLMNYRHSGEWTLAFRGSLSGMMLSVTVWSFGVGIALRLIPGLAEVGLRLSTLSLVASVLALATAFPEKRAGPIGLGLVLYSVNIVQAALSGWKEEVLVLLLLLGVFAFPYYRKVVLGVMPVALLAFLLVIPTYNSTFRALNWQGEVGAREAAALSAAAVAEAGAAELQANAWTFMAGRLSEISLFTVYLRSTPAERPFMGTTITRQAVSVVVPRVLWDGKPDVERLVMQRVYANGVTTADANVSAKPQFAVDGYLSAGALGVWLSCFLYGLVASGMSRIAERWFGGYLVGSGLLYTALFQVLWRGNCFEFVVPVVFWSFAIMVVLFVLGRTMGWVVPARRRVWL